MDRIRKFDEELKNTFADAFFIARLGGGLLCCIGMLMMLFPVQMASERKIIWSMLLGCAICANGVCQWMLPYLRLREGDKTVSIYKKLEFMPVTKAQIRKVRCGYLNRLCICLGTAAFFMQQGVALLNHSFGIVSVLFAAGWAVMVWLAGCIFIYVR